MNLSLCPSRNHRELVLGSSWHICSSCPSIHLAMCIDHTSWLQHTAGFLNINFIFSNAHHGWGCGLGCQYQERWLPPLQMREQVIHTIFIMGLHLKSFGTHTENAEYVRDTWYLSKPSQQREVLRAWLKPKPSQGAGMKGQKKKWQKQWTWYGGMRRGLSERGENNPCAEAEVSVNQSVRTQHPRPPPPGPHQEVPAVRWRHSGSLGFLKHLLVPFRMRSKSTLALREIYFSTLTQATTAKFFAHLPHKQPLSGARTRARWETTCRKIRIRTKEKKPVSDQWNEGKEFQGKQRLHKMHSDFS